MGWVGWGWVGWGGGGAREHVGNDFASVTQAWKVGSSLASDKSLTLVWGGVEFGPL